jgi:pyridoxal phosphate phosphatase PHOSPHO2
MDYIIFDFDYTLIDHNSDTYFYNEENQQILKEKRKTTQWTELMCKFSIIKQGYLLKKIATEGKSIQEIKSKLEEIKISESIKKILKLCKSKDQKIIIVSDANNLFIEWILKKNEVYEYFDKIVTNSTDIIKENDIEYIQVNKYMKHDCINNCPENICKGLIVEDIERNRVVYIGDGSNDFCPLTKLNDQDSVFARNNFPLQKRIINEKEKLKLSIHYWNDHDELLELFLKKFQ